MSLQQAFLPGTAASDYEMRRSTSVALGGSPPSKKSTYTPPTLGAAGGVDDSGSTIGGASSLDDPAFDSLLSRDHFVEGVADLRLQPKSNICQSLCSVTVGLPLIFSNPLGWMCARALPPPRSVTRRRRLFAREVCCH